ncbi:MAG: ABC transporter substrate-binding protein [Candidatus Tectomicrobia bacterium]|nr:ABC transporter substrate-binding protein [Candidatus Tectomicrobia bacterium]
MRHPLRTMALGFVLPLILVLLVSPPAQGKLAGKEVTIGLLTSLTGFAARYGQQDQPALQIALEDINGSGGVGGVPLKMIVYDTGGKNEQSISMVRRLAESDKVLAMIGPWLSGEANVAFPVANRLTVPIISSSSAAPGISAKNRPWAFRTTMTAERGLELAFTKFLLKYPAKTASIMYDNADFVMKLEGTGLFPPLLAKKGLKLISSITFQTGEMEFGAQVTKIKNDNPDVVMISGFYQQTSNLVRTMRAQGMKQPVYVGIGSSNPAFTQMAGAAGEGVMNTQDFWRGDPRPEVQSFVKRYEERSSGVPTPFPAASLYDTIMMLKQVIETAGVTNRPEDLQKDRERIRDGFANLKGFKGLAGEFSMDPNGDGIKQTYPMVVRNGTWALVDW